MPTGPLRIALCRAALLLALMAGGAGLAAAATPADADAARHIAVVAALAAGGGPAALVPERAGRSAECGGRPCGRDASCVTYFPMKRPKQVCVPKGTTACGDTLCRHGTVCLRVPKGYGTDYQCHLPGSRACGTGVCPPGRRG